MSKVIDSKATAHVRPWQFPELNEPTPHSPPPEPPEEEAESINLLTAEQIAEIQSQAYQEGFDQGRQEGRDAGAKDIKLKMAQFDKLIVALEKPFEQLDNQVEQELINLVKALTSALLYREIGIDPQVLISVVREAMDSLPVAARDVRLHLHPDDTALIHESMALSDDDRSWKVIEDPTLRRGDCRIVSNTSQIDASLETRLSALLASVFQSETQQEEG